MPVDLERQVHDYAEFLRETAGVVDADAVATRSLDQTRRHGSWRFKPFTVAVAAAFAVLLVVGGVALLVDSPAPVAPVGPQPAAPLTSELQGQEPVDEPQIPTSGSVEPTVTAPPADGITSVVWFKGSFYGVADPFADIAPGDLPFRNDSDFEFGRIYSTDGSSWEKVQTIEVDPGVSADTAIRFVDLAADAENLVALGEPLQRGSEGHSGCQNPPGAPIVAVSSDGETWAVSHITTDVPTAPSDAICVSIFPATIALTSEGVLVTASVEVDVDHDGLIARALGPSTAQNLATLWDTADGFAFTTTSGTSGQVSFSELGYTPEDVAMPPSGTITWLSRDQGTTWTKQSRVGTSPRR